MKSTTKKTKKNKIHRSCANNGGSWTEEGRKEKEKLDSKGA